MADETTAEGELLTESAIDADAALPGEPGEGAGALAQTVEVIDVGPCKKHIKVTVDRQAIDDRFNDKYTEIVRNDKTPLKGFRPGKAPRKVIEWRFRSAVEEEVRNEVLMASLEQLATDYHIAPLAPPELDPSKIEIPEHGPFFYEFDVEVRPEFDLPSYKGLTLKRWVKTFTQADIEKEQRRLLEPAGQLVPKPGEDIHVEMDDYIVADVVITHGQRELNNLKEVRVKVEKQLALADGLAANFGKVLVGAKVGDERTVTIQLSESSGHQALRGQEIQAKFKINDIKVVRLPELSPEMLREFGVRNEDQFQELLGAVLERRLEYAQRQSFRAQILAQLADASKWELPEDLLRRQAKRALTSRVMEMRSAGMSDDEIAGRQRVLEHDAIRSTERTLREHFVLQKIAELEKIEIEESDIDTEIERIADRTGESARKVRARMQKDDSIEALGAEILERRALDLVLDSAAYQDVELKSEDEEGNVATVSAEAAPGASGEPAPTEN